MLTPMVQAPTQEDAQMAMRPTHKSAVTAKYFARTLKRQPFGITEELLSRGQVLRLAGAGEKIEA